MKLRIILADNHQLVREGMQALLSRENDFDVVALAEDGMSASRLVRQLEPDVLVTEVMMQGLNGIETIRRLRNDLRSLRILCVSTLTEPRCVMEALDAGAAGFMPKGASASELAQAIREVGSGRTHVSQSLMGFVIDRIRVRLRSRSEAEAEPSPRELLTSREREIVQLFSEDLSTRDIAIRLRLSPKTVSTHRENVLRKLGVRGIAGLTRYALSEGLSPAARMCIEH